MALVPVPAPVSQASGNLFSLFFEEESDKVTVDHNPVLDITDNITLECFVYLTKECTGYLIAKKQSFALAVKKGQLMVSFNNARPGWVWKNSKHQLDYFKWRHVAVTYATKAYGTAEATIFVDGVPVRKFTDMMGPLDHAAQNDLLFGVHLAEEHISGYIANVRVWKKILTPEKLTQIAVYKGSAPSRSGLPEPDLVSANDPDLVGWWPLDRGYGTEAEDKARHSLHGRIVAPKWAMTFNKEADIIPSTLTSDYKAMLNNPMGSDIKLRIVPSSQSDPSGGSSTANAASDDDPPSDDAGDFLYAHKIILATRCRVFHAMLTGEMKERNSSSVHLREISFSSLKKLVEFIYTDSVDVDGDSVLELFQAADKYDLPRLKLLCEAFLIENINVDNACQLFEAAERYNAKLLRAVTLRFILSNYADIIVTPGYLSIGQKLMLDINTEAKKTVFNPSSGDEPPSKRRKITETE